MTIKAQVSFGMEGEFQLITQGPTRGRIEHPPFKNLIVNNGLDRISARLNGGPQWCRVGTSNAAVDPTQNALVGQLAETSTIQATATDVYVAGPPAYVECSRTYRFATGVAAGNIAEVGAAFSSVASGNGLFSRALVLPLAITVLSDEQLDVVYKVRIYPNTADVTGTVTLEGTPTDYTMRFACWGSGLSQSFWNNPFLGASTVYNNGGSVGLDTLGATSMSFGSPTSNSASDLSTITALAYTNGTYARTYRLTYGLNVCNFAGGIRKIMFPLPASTAGAGAQIIFTPNINKTASKTLTLDISVGFTRRP